MNIDCSLCQGLIGNPEIDSEIIKERVIHLILWHGVLRSPEFQKKSYQNRIDYIGHVLCWRAADSLALKYYFNSMYGRMCRLNLHTVYGMKG